MGVFALKPLDVMYTDFYILVLVFVLLCLVWATKWLSKWNESNILN